MFDRSIITTRNVLAITFAAVIAVFPRSYASVFEVSLSPDDSPSLASRAKKAMGSPAPEAVPEVTPEAAPQIASKPQIKPLPARPEGPVDHNNPSLNKTDAATIEVVLPESVDGIYWLEQKIPIGNTVRYQGYFANKAPWVTPGVPLPDNAYDNALIHLPSGSERFTINNFGYYPVTYQAPKVLNGGENLRIHVNLYGWGGASPYCENFGDFRQGYISIRNCSSEYPLNSMSLGLGFWSIFGGHINPDSASNVDGRRITESVLSVMARHPDSIDEGAGIELGGNSYGAIGSILQSMILPEIQSRIAVVNVLVPSTLFVKSMESPGGLTVHADKAWGNFDRDKADFRKVAPTGKLNHIFYRIHGGSQDTQVGFDTEFFDVCNNNKIACLGTWHGIGHAGNEPGINLDTALFPGDPNMDVRLDKVLPIFTNSTANAKYAVSGDPTFDRRGHYNLGLSWHANNTVDNVSELSVPLKYKAFKNFTTDPVNLPFPDMKNEITASVTLRRAQNFVITPGATYHWTRGAQSGTVVAHPTLPEVTIDGVHFVSSEKIYKNLVLKRP